MNNINLGQTIILSDNDNSDPQTFSFLEVTVSLATERGEYYLNRGKDNEDRVATSVARVNDNSSIIIDMICDGVGGYERGAEASQYMCETLKELCETKIIPVDDNDLETHIVRELITKTIQKYEKQNFNLLSGTAFVLSIRHNVSLTIAHLGDCNGFLFAPDGTFIQKTRDHKPEAFEDRFRLTEYLHLNDPRHLMDRVRWIKSELSEHPDGLILILTSDGISDNLNTSIDERECHPQLTKLIQRDFQKEDTTNLCGSIMEEAKERMKLKGTRKGQELDVKPDNSTCLVRYFPAS